MDRREFLHKCVSGAAGAMALAGLAGCSRHTPQMTEAPSAPAATGGPGVSQPTDVKIGSNRWDPNLVDVDLAVARNNEPAELVRSAVDNYGGIQTWVQSGDVVVIKPNLAWGRQPAQAATTSPHVLTAVISLCQEAGAGEILVVEHSCDSATVTFDMSEARTVCKDAGVPLISLENDRLYRQVPLKKGVNFDSDLVAQDILDCHVYINLPIAKVHGSSCLTLALKNQMGTVWNRGRYHSAGGVSAPGRNLHQNIASLGASLRPTLNIIDATRVLVSNGPKGPGLTKELNTVIVSADIVAADAYATKLMGKDLTEVPHITMAEQMGLGSADLDLLKVITA